MTAHELARKLLEGPDVLVFVDQDCDYGSSSEPSEITETEPVTLWQIDYVGHRWPNEYHFHKPNNPDLVTRSVEALRLR